MSVPMPKRLESFVQMANETAEQMAKATASPSLFYQNQIAIRVEPRLMPGHVPTPEEAAEDAARRAEYDARRRESWRIYDEARPALDAITDPLSRAIIDLHSSETIESPRCDGCDMEGYECEPPEWPCRTMEAVAAHHGIELPDASHLWRRFE